VFLFSFFKCFYFAFISKQQQQKNRHFIDDLSVEITGISLGFSKNLRIFLGLIRNFLKIIAVPKISGIFMNFLEFLGIFSRRRTIKKESIVSDFFPKN
jgi:hypothetical protein